MNNLYEALIRDRFVVLDNNSRYLIVKLPNKLSEVKELTDLLRVHGIDSTLVLGFDEDEQIYTLYNQNTRTNSGIVPTEKALLKVEGNNLELLSEIPSNKNEQPNKTEFWVIEKLFAGRREGYVAKKDSNYLFTESSKDKRLFKSKKKAKKYIKNNLSAYPNNLIRLFKYDKEQ